MWMLVNDGKANGNPLLGFVTDNEDNSETRSKEARSTEVVDQMARSTKKVKTTSAEGDPGNQDEEMPQEEEMLQADGEEPPHEKPVDPKDRVSFQDMVLHAGPKTDHVDEELGFSSEDIIRMVKEGVCPTLENDKEENIPPSPFNPKSEVKVSMEEYESWCTSWSRTLIVCLLGKKVSLRYMAPKLQHL